MKRLKKHAFRYYMKMKSEFSFFITSAAALERRGGVSEWNARLKRIVSWHTNCKDIIEVTFMN